MFINQITAVLIITISRNVKVRGEIAWNGKNWSYGCEFNGNDLMNAESQSANCARVCIENGDCTHYVWTDQNNGTCWLKRNGATKADAVESSDSTALCGIISGGQKIAWTDGNWAHRCDFKGNDLSSTQVIPELCSSRCDDTLGCTHYVWTDHNNGTCWLKQYGATKLDAIQNSNPLAVCGVVRGGQNIAWKGKNWAVGCDFNGNNLTSFPSIREDCRNLCVYMPGCTHYTWTKYDKGTCYMKENGATKFDAFYISNPLTECGIINDDYIAWNEDSSAVGCDFIGNDLKSQTTSREDCRNLCATTRSCTHFSWTDYFRGTCWMKKNGAHRSDAIRLTSDPSALCGIIDVGGHNFSWNANNSAEGCDFNGNDLHSALSSKHGCRDTCIATPKCTHFVWTDYDEGTCFMKSNGESKSNAIPSLNPATLCGIVIDLSSADGRNITWNENNSAVGCDFIGNHLTSVASSEERCRELCVLTKGCTHFSWTSTIDDLDGGVCSMKKNGATKSDAIRSLKHSTMCGIISSSVHESVEPKFGIQSENDENQCDHCKVEAQIFTVGSVTGYKLAVQTRNANQGLQLKPCITSITEPAINLVLLFETIPLSFLQTNEFCSNHNTSHTDANADESLRCPKMKVALREPNFLIIYENFQDVNIEVVSQSTQLDVGNLVANGCSISDNSSVFQNLRADNYTTKREWPHNIVDSIRYLHKSVMELDLASNGLEELVANLFDDFEHLRVMKLSDNKLEALMPGMFKNQQKVHSLFLDRNRLQHITSDVFEGLSSLRLLDLSCNNLGMSNLDTFSDIAIKDNEQIDANLFGNLDMLIELNLSHNKLTSISGSVFRELGNLRIVRINDNHLQSIHTDAFSHTTNLEEIYLDRNQLAFADSHYNSSLFQHLPKLKQLHLQHNIITNISPDWRSIPELRILSLGSNRLTTLDYEDFNFISSAPVILSLEDNNISVNITETIDEMNNVIVVLNTIDCCNFNVSNFMTYVIKSSSRIRFAIPDLSCSSTNATAARSISEFNFRTMTCPMEECPLNCRCVKKPFDNALLFNCSYANLKHPPNIVYTGNYAQVELYLDHNNLLELPNVEHDLYITVLQASHNLLRDIHPKNLPQNLRVLNVSHNQIQCLEERVFDELNSRDALQSIVLGHNPWLCDCSKEAEKLVAFVKRNKKLIEDLKDLNCPEQQVDIYGLNDQFIENICLQRRNKIVMSALAVLIFFVAFFSILYFKYQQTIKIWLYAHNLCLWWVDEDDLDKNKTYDAFISYSHLDEDFAIGTIVAKLENGTPSFKTCVHERDWLAGGSILESISQSIANSRRTVIILSQNFLKSMWGQTEFQYAHDTGLAEKRVRVIIIIYGDIGSIDELDPDLQSYLRTNTYIQWGEKWFWEKLRYALGHKT